ncbi:MAG: hypothetical protein H0U39_09285 [Segetibacter sp.]|nr:hypothetical protein [Segetibacter sp.]
MSVNPQYTFDNTGNPVGVFLTITDWYQITQELNIEVPEWQKKLIDLRLEDYDKNVTLMQDADEFFAQLDREDMK